MALDFVSSDDDFWGFDEDVEILEADDKASDNWEDYDVLPSRLAVRPPEDDRRARVSDGDRIGRRARRGAKTPRHKTAHRGHARG